MPRFASEAQPLNCATCCNSFRREYLVFTKSIIIHIVNCTRLSNRPSPSQERPASVIKDGPMTSGDKIPIRLAVSVGMILLFALFLKFFHGHARLPLTVVGSVIKQDGDTWKQSPIEDVEISAPLELGAGH